MTAAIAIAAAIAAGVEPRRTLLLAATLYFPPAVISLAGLGFLVSRRPGVSASAVFCEAVAAELRSGSPLRDALVSARAPVAEPASLRIPPATLAESASLVAADFAEVGDELELTIAAAARSGGASADLFDEIASVAIAKSEIAHEVRVASAPGRVTVLIFVAAPLLYLGSRARAGGLAQLIATPEQRVTSLIGLGLVAAGLLAALLTLRGSR